MGWILVIADSIKETQLCHLRYGMDSGFPYECTRYALRQNGKRTRGDIL